MSLRPTRRTILALAAGAAAAPLSARAAAGGSGLDLSAMDRSVRPGDDFFRYANGGWLDRYELKPDEVYAGSRTRIGDLRRERLRKLIEDAARDPAPAGSLQAQVGALYASYLDVAARDAAGLAALAPERARIAALKDHRDLARLLGEAPMLGLASPFEASLFYDFHEPGRLRYNLTPGGLGLPTREHYLDAVHAETLAAYQVYVADILALAGAANPAAEAAAVVAFERRLAEGYWPTTKARDFLSTANNRSAAELAALAPSFDWSGFLQAAGAGDLDVLIVAQPSAMGPVAKVVAETPLAVWRSYLTFHLVSDNADYLTQDLEARRFTFHGKRLQGQAEPRPRWARGVDLVEGFLGQQLGRLYVEAYFPPERKAQVGEIFANVRAEMRRRLLAADWMGEVSRTEALRKIDTLRVKIGYPDRWPPFPPYAFDRGDLYGNLRQGRRLRWLARLDQARRPLDPVLWETTPQNTSAAANPAFNEVTVPAGTLEPPFFNPDADLAVNYGAIGGVLAHELGHMFDQVGRRLDAEGRLRDWWAPEDAARYELRAAKVERQYSAFEALPGRFVNGRQTLNENIADINGLSVAFGAWRRALGGKAAPVKDGLTGAQRFFLGWAQMRAAKERDAFLGGQLAGGVHSPDRFRVNGPVRNIDAWYAAFGVKPGDALYLPPEQRAHFW